MKICKRNTCKFKGDPQSESNFYKSNKNLDGLESYCKNCQSERNKKYRLRNSEKLNKYEEARKLTHLADFRQRYLNNTESYKLRNKLYYETHKDRHFERTANWILNNRDRFREIQRKAKQKIQQERPDYLREIHSKRRALLKKAIPKWANRNEIRLIYKLAREMEKFDGLEYHVDHIIPLSHPLVCGLHVETNLQVLLGEDNLKKNNFFEIDLFEDLELSLDEILEIFE
jgi:hypothetical protein